MHKKSSSKIKIKNKFHKLEILRNQVHIDRGIVEWWGKWLNLILNKDELFDKVYQLTDRTFEIHVFSLSAPKINKLDFKQVAPAQLEL